MAEPAMATDLATSHRPPDPSAERNGPGFSLAAWWGWVPVALITVAVAVTWLPALHLPLGDSHEGRILARFGLHMRNFWELGPIRSGLGTSWEPYGSSYAHHPPLANLFHLAVSALFGQGEWQLRLYGYLSGLATVPLMAGLLRTLRLRWGAVLLAVLVMAATPFFWIYGRLGGGFALLLAFAAAVVHLRRTREPSRGLVWGTAALGAAVVMLSWTALAVAGVLGLWLWRGRGLDRPTVAVGLAMTGAAVAMGAWILWVTGLSGLAGQVELRTRGGEFTVAEFLRRQWRWTDALLPTRYLVLVVPGLAVGLWDRRTRLLTGLTLAVTVGWAVGLPQGAFLHDYWNLFLLVPGAIGMGALFDRWARRWPGWPTLVPAVLLAAHAALGLWVIGVAGTYHERYFVAPSRAGELVKETTLPADQRVAWVTPNIAAPRWVAWYRDLPVSTLEADRLGEPSDHHLVLVRLRALPEWVPESATDRAIDRRDGYALVPAGDLRSP